jgi:hypothetical protein
MRLEDDDAIIYDPLHMHGGSYTNDDVIILDGIIARDDAIGLDEVIIHDGFLCACYYSKMAGQIFMKFGVEVMSLEQIQVLAF